MHLTVSKLSAIRSERCLFDNISFTVLPGELLLIEGENGAGKTSLLQILAGLLLPTAGDIHCEFRPFCYLGHKAGVHPDLSVVENIRFLMALNGLSCDIEPILKTLGLQALANRFTRYLSSGQKRRILLSTLLYHPAKLWLLDEPLTALDSLGQTLIQTLIKAHLDKNGAVVVSSHQPLHLSDLNIKKVRL